MTILPTPSHSPTMSCRTYFLLLVLLALTAIQPVDSVPTILLKNAASKCLMVDAPHEMTLLINYAAPGTYKEYPVYA